MTDRRVAFIVVLLAAVLAGCSISSTESPPEGMRCVKAHDEYHDGTVRQICDEYAPITTPEPSS